MRFRQLGNIQLDYRRYCTKLSHNLDLSIIEISVSDLLMKIAVLKFQRNTQLLGILVHLYTL